MNATVTEDLFVWGKAYARSSDPSTSHAAARSIEGKAVTRMELLCLEAIRTAKEGMTTWELCKAVGLEWNSVSPRLKPLERKGLIVRDGTRMGDAGRMCVVWKASWK